MAAGAALTADSAGTRSGVAGPAVTRAVRRVACASTGGRTSAVAATDVRVIAVVTGGSWTAIRRPRPAPRRTVIPPDRFSRTTAGWAVADDGAVVTRLVHVLASIGTAPVGRGGGVVRCHAPGGPVVCLLVGRSPGVGRTAVSRVVRWTGAVDAPIPGGRPRSRAVRRPRARHWG
jgi:hypothetical protein